ncbi:beta-ketoacyl synthase N-terminal-like domain-containing protein [Chitinophaga sp. GbtcB8]|uniref:beta-ketoacyl synthase N-terminal-like domain-containing protein n=1 Tax=Chitinophaga sp. GbtcB8 TaxID=2824753 RepID=UPI001C2F232C|nr:beta-ketoacyl synthase N-terminal-like domain-containing protein [Chitinophaga sp. GbtcB8]
MKTAIAIIGLSMKVAEADNLEAFWETVQTGEHSFKPLSAQRLNDIFSRFGEFEVTKGSYLDRIDLFDNEYFKISPAEAERMDPEQRLMLEHAVKAVYNAGYVPAELRGQRIGFFHTFGQSMYRHFFDEFNNLALTAHMPGMVGTRVANFMDWRGPLIGVDTTCSSSLTALYYACQSLANDDCSLAMVGSVSLSVSSRDHAVLSPVMSKREQCHPFDGDADGILGGEGIVCVLLKRADAAIRDGDPIHAIIKGGAINHGGALIQNISAPSPVSQAEVIRMAWENSGVNPAHIRFIEAHGTGTILGDPIEFSGIDAAFKESLPGMDKVCSISSVKGQLGHLGPVAGLAGLARLVLALKQQQLPPQVGFNSINPHIPESDSPVKVQRTLQPWNSEVPRAGGVSSFGLTGTNVHMIVEEYAAPVNTAPATTENGVYAMKLGGATPAKAANVSAYLLQYLQQYPQTNLAQLSYSVNRIMGEVTYGELVLFKDREELINILQQKLTANNPQPTPFTTPRKKATPPQVFLLIPGLLTADKITAFLDQSPAMAALYTAVTAGHEELTATQQSFLLHYCAAKTLNNGGFAPDKIIGAQSGKLLSLLLMDKVTLPEALLQLAAQEPVQEPFNSAAFVQFLNTLDAQQQYLLVVMGSQGEMITACRQWLTAQAPAHIQAVFPTQGRDLCLDILTAYYNSGHELRFANLFGKTPFLHNLHLPVLEPKRHWPQVISLAVVNNAPAALLQETAAAPQVFTTADIIAGVTAIWQDKLKVTEIGLEDDFFDLGGSSLLGLDVLQQIAKRYAVDLEYADIFDYCTVSQQAALIEEKLGAIPPVPVVNTTPAATGVISRDDLRSLEYELLLQRIQEQEAAERIAPQHILLTGGTGFLGVYVIKELLEKTNATITCLVRAADDAAAQTRLAATVSWYFPHLQLPPQRISGICGDITLADLGLTAAGNTHLQDVDTVHHLAANVSHFGKATHTNSINYEGTVKVLEWAKKKGVQYFNHYSTNAVATGGFIENVESISFYETDLDLGQQFGRRIYPASKFRAEQYIKENSGRLHVNVFRIGNIGGDSQTGLFQQNIGSNNFYQRLRTLASLGYYCEEIAATTFETTPVDIVCGITVALSLHKNELFSTFHIMEANPIRLSQFVQQLAACNIELQLTDAATFEQHVQKLMDGADLSTENTALGILRYSSTDAADTRFMIQQQATKAYLEKISARCTYDIEKYAHTIVQYCVREAFIQVPRTQATI